MGPALSGYFDRQFSNSLIIRTKQSTLKEVWKCDPDQLLKGKTLNFSKNYKWFEKLSQAPSALFVFIWKRILFMRFYRASTLKRSKSEMFIYENGDFRKRLSWIPFDFREQAGNVYVFGITRLSVYFTYISMLITWLIGLCVYDITLLIIVN